MVVAFAGRQRSAFAFRILRCSSFVCSGGSLRRRFIHTLLSAFQIAPDALFGIADRIRQFNLGQIMSIKTFDVTFVGGGDSFLRLYNLEIVSHSGGEAVL